MNPDANAKRAVAEAVTDLVGGRNGVRGSRERCEERVTLRVHLDPRVPGERGANNIAVGGEKVRVALAVLVKELRRARDVGEEERDGAAREIRSHAESIIPRDRAPVYSVSRLCRTACAGVRVCGHAFRAFVLSHDRIIRDRAAEIVDDAFDHLGRTCPKVAGSSPARPVVVIIIVHSARPPGTDSWQRL